MIFLGALVLGVLAVQNQSVVAVVLCAGLLITGAIYDLIKVIRETR